VISEKFIAFRAFWVHLGDFSENDDVLVKWLPLLARGEKPSKT
jgi:hypothetical protein